MAAVGVVDYLGLPSALYDKMAELEPHYHYTLIDQVQDFGTVGLSVLSHLARNEPNDIFLCGDAARSVMPKHQFIRRLH